MIELSVCPSPAQSRNCRCLLTEPKLTRKPSLLDLKAASDEAEQKTDPATSLANHLSEYETGRLAECLGVRFQTVYNTVLIHFYVSSVARER